MIYLNVWIVPEKNISLLSGRMNAKKKAKKIYTYIVDEESLWVKVYSSVKSMFKSMYTTWKHQCARRKLQKSLFPSANPSDLCFCPTSSYLYWVCVSPSKYGWWASAKKKKRKKK